MVSFRKYPFFLFLQPLVGYIFVAYHLNWPIWNDVQQSFADSTTYYRIEIVDYPVEKPKTIALNANCIPIDTIKTASNLSYQIKLYLQKDSAAQSLIPGDVIVARTKISTPHSKNPEEFDYGKYLRLVGFSGTAYVPATDWIYVEHHSPKGIRAYATYCRNALYQRYRTLGLSGAELGVVSALTLGYTEDLDSDTRQIFTRAGAAHILAVSGMHTAIIFLVLWQLVTLFGFRNILYHERMKRRIVVTSIICILWFYGFITGLTPSVLRSVLMITIFLYGHSRYYPTNTYNALAAAAFIELTIYPLHLFTASFLLSYFAVISILYFSPRFLRLCSPKMRLTRWLWESIAVSFAAQIGTLPLTLYLFGQTTNCFLITNIVVLLISYVVMIFAVTAQMFGFIPVVGVWFAEALDSTTHLMITVTEWIESLPYAVSYLQITTPEFILLCLAIIFATLFFRKQQWYWLMLSCLLFVGIISLYAYDLNQESKVSTEVTFERNREKVILYREGRENILFTRDSTFALSLTDSYRRKHYLQQPQIIIVP